MAFTTEPSLVITDGVNTVTLMDSAATTTAAKLALTYRLPFGTWGPKVSQRNDNPLGLPYLPVMEEMTIDIKGSSPAACYSALQVLNTLLDQADRWWNNEIVNPVLVKYLPKGSSRTTALQDIIMGGSANDQNAEMVSLPDDINYTGEVSFLKGVRVKFWRRIGTWLGEQESQNISTSYVAQPGPITVTWSDFATILSPVDLRVGTSPAGSSGHSCTGFLAVTNDSRYIGAFAGTAETSGSGVATADAANFPTNANVNRFTVNPSVGGFWNISAVPVAECEYFAVYVKVRNNSTTLDAYIQAATTTLIQQEVKVPAAATQRPTAVFLGIFPTRGRTPQAFGFGSALQLSLRSVGGSLTFDIDELLIVCINRSSNVIAVTSVPQLQISASNGMALLNRLLLEPQGEFATGIPTSDVLQSYSGSVYCYTGSNASVKLTSIAYFLTDTAFWNTVNSANTAKSTIDINATRYKAYLVPE